MNYFAVKWHADGVQIAKNSTKGSTTPISFSIHCVSPYDPATCSILEAQSLVVPSWMSPVFTTTVYHGTMKCDLFQLTQHWHGEEERLDPSRYVEGRRLVVGCLARVADSIEKAYLAG